MHSVLVSSLWWWCVNYLISRKSSESKVTRNLVSSVHAVAVISTFLANYFGRITTTESLNFLYVSSMGYYLSDTLNEAKELCKGFRLYQLGMMAHHIITISALGYLFDPVASNYLYMSFFLAEVSNLPLYLMYHYHKRLTNHHIVFAIVFTEFLGYLVLRMIICLIIIVDSFCVDTSYAFRAMAVSMYLISGIWAYKLFCQTMSTFKKL